MPPLQSEPTHQNVEGRLRGYLRAAHLRQPDHTWHEEDSDQLVLAWYSEDVALVVELSANGPLDLELRPLRETEASRSRTRADAGDQRS